ncbi:MAG: hypothetical protein M3O22_00705 [Pseudomonadota bacterium]|nr:hypothetical protein [Pseudomonadota bacterium]
MGALNYFQLIWATLFGWVFWNALPGPLVIAGSAIIVAGNLFILCREQRMKRENLP